MSHRRYATEPSGRPAEFPPDALRKIESILARYPTRQAALLPVLWVAQETWGWISRESAEEVARILRSTVDLARRHGVRAGSARQAGRRRRGAVGVRVWHAGVGPGHGGDARGARRLR